MAFHESKTEYETLSARAEAMLNRSETYDVEFKESVNGLESSDIVSFANSDSGGTILIGIREAKSPNGQQRGEIIGCPIGDKEKLKILSKVASCVPDITAEIIVENLNDKPFFRVEIPSGADKPYCTSGGTYKIRGDGITQNLNPTQLLNIFIAKENDRFLKHFREATDVFEKNLLDTKEIISARINEISDMVDTMKSNISVSLESITESAKKAEGLSDEAIYFSDEALDFVRRLDTRMDKMENDIDELGEGVRRLTQKLNSTTEQGD